MRQLLFQPVHIYQVFRSTEEERSSSMAPADGMQGMVAAFITSPKGKEMIQKFLSSPEGKTAIDNYLASPDGQKMGILLLSRALDGLDLPPDLKEHIRTVLDTGKNLH
jgi:hypothetical protein